MKLLIDTNVILDMVFKRNGYDIVMELFRKIKNSKAVAYITASSVTDLFYIIRKETHNINQTYIIMKNIFRLVVILSVTEQDIQEAFKQKWKDFEDCVQYITGKNNKIDYIITSNNKDYIDDLIPVLTPTAWIKMINNTQQNK